MNHYILYRPGSAYTVIGNLARKNQGDGIRLLKEAIQSKLRYNVAFGNEGTDLVDENQQCDENKWRGNIGKGNQSCVR